MNLDLRNSVLVLAIAAVVWIGCDVLGLTENGLIPPLGAVMADIVTDAHFYLARTVETTTVALSGLGLSIAVTIVFGCLVAAIPSSDPVLRGLAALTQTIPVIAIAPVIFYLFGWGIGTKAFVALLISFFPLFASFIGEFDRLGGSVHRQAHAIGLGAVQRARYLFVPAGLVGIADGLRVAAVLAVVGSAIGEILLPEEGLGRVIMLARSQFNSVKVFGAALCLMALGLIFTAIAEALAKIARRGILWL